MEKSSNINVRAKKSLGQNFLINQGVCEKIAALCPMGFGVLEIGPGLGALTTRLASRAKKVVAVELDADIIPLLRQKTEALDNVSIIEGDILKVPLAEIIANEFDGMRVAVFGNLPYYITSPVIMRVLEERLPVEFMVAMVQKEAGQRFCAAEASRAVGAVTLAIRYFCEPAVLFDVSPGSFSPAPKVTSSVIRLDVVKETRVKPKNEKNMFSCIKAAFSQRRKTAANAISSGLGISKELVSKALCEVGAQAASRPENLTLAQYAELSDRLC
ncbi:MAG: 16S rRNA (adenine(1518)-N(6)/adenine(1519)-N(6))-dimethyltransferase RsmA [Oscillospiraceae bacterium]